MKENNKLFSLTCPTCYSALQAVGDHLYQCSRGHVCSLQELLIEQQKTTEKLLWAVTRIMAEQTHILMLMGEQAPALNHLLAQQAAEFSEVIQIESQASHPHYKRERRQGKADSKVQSAGCWCSVQ